MPRPSADLPRAPARRRRPDGRTDTRASGRPSRSDGALFVTMTITSPHNEQLKEVRKLAGRKWRDKLREFVAEGEDLLAAADAAGWAPRRCGSCAAGLGAGRARRSRRTLLRDGLAARLGHARARRLPAALGAARPPGRCAWRCGAWATRATSAPCCAARSRSAPAASRSARAAPIRTGRRPCARRWARCSPCRSRACARSPSCRAARWRWSPRDGRPLAELRGRAT